MKDYNKHPKQKELRKLFDYKNGELFWKTKHNNQIANNKKAGHQEKFRGYTNISVKNKKFKLHQLVWVYHNGAIPKGLVIDHIDGNKRDSRIENLRLATMSSNSLNTTKLVGVRKHSSADCWQAYITIEGTYNHLGNFKSQTEAFAARSKATQAHFKQIYG